MSIDSINSITEAVKVYYSKDTSDDDKRKLLNKFPDILKYASVDSTKYEISDEDFDDAKNKGIQNAKDATGHDGKADSTLSTIGTAVGSAAVGIGGACASFGKSFAGKAVQGGLNAISGRSTSWTSSGTVGKDFKLTQKVSPGLGDKAADAASGKGDGVQNLGDIATIVMGAAVEAKYMIEKPNEEQIEAAKKLYNPDEGGGLLVDGQEQLNLTQEEMTEASEEVIALTEEAEDANNKANEQIEEDKTMFDFYRAQYEALKAKAEGGEELLPEEKALMKKLAPRMEELGANINDTTEETSDTVSGLNDDIAEYQDTFDESAEKMAEVEGLTEYAEGFDETTKTLCTVEGVSHTVNGLGVGAAGVRLALKGGGFFSWVVAPFVALAGVTVYRSYKSSSEQFSGAQDVGNEINYREATQTLNSETNEIYETELDNYAANIELVEDLELEVPEDLEVPEAPVTTESAEGQQSSSLFLSAGQDNTGSGQKEDDDKKNKEVK